MTAQFPDHVRYGRKLFDLVDIAGEGSFEPRVHDLDPVSLHTACRRGFICTYAVAYEMLLVDRLDINLNGSNGRARSDAPALNGAAPITAADDEFNTRYERIRMRVPFTGTLLIGRDLTGERYFDWWHNPLLRYEEVHELVFEEGKLVSALDISAAVARGREQASRDIGGRGSTPI